MPRRLSRAEQETIITRAADEKEWHVYSCDPAVKRRLVKLTTALGISLSIVDEWGVEARLPISCVRFMTPVVVSAQERANQVARGRRLGAAKKEEAAQRRARASSEAVEAVPEIAGREG